MEPLLPLIIAVLLDLVVWCCGADTSSNFLKIKVTPSLVEDDYHEYIFDTKCPVAIGNKPKFHSSYAQHLNNSLFIVNIGSDAEKCPEGYKVAVTIHIKEATKLHKSDDKFLVWTFPFMTTTAAFGNLNMIVHQVQFANSFKLVILPNLAPNSSPKMMYRVDVFCAGSERVEFKAYTQSETTVVLNSDEQKCTEVGSDEPKYDIKVWPIRLEWMHTDNLTIWNRKKLKFEPRFLTWAQMPAAQMCGLNNRAQIISDDPPLYEVHFPNYFNLDISPPLLPSSGQVYYVEVKHAGREAVTFRTYTDESAQILMTTVSPTTATVSSSSRGERDDDTTTEYEYDIFVSKLDKTKAESANKIFPIDEKSVRKELRVPIENRTTYLFNYSEEMSMDTDSVGAAQGEEPTERKFKRLSDDVTEMQHNYKILKTDVEMVKNQVKQMQETFQETFSELREFLEDRLTNNQKMDK